MRSIDATWEQDFEPIIQTNGKSHFLVEINRKQHIFNTNSIGLERNIKKYIVNGHIKIMLPMIESVYPAETIETLFDEFPKTHNFDEFITDYYQKNFYIFLISNGKFHHNVLPAKTQVQFGKIRSVEWYCHERHRLSIGLNYVGKFDTETEVKMVEKIEKKLKLKGDLYDLF